MAKKLITVMQKGRIDDIPRIVKTRSDYITEMGRYGYWRFKKFSPVDGVSLAIEAGEKYENFEFEGQMLNGLVMFFNGDECKPIASLTDQQIALIHEWFAVNMKEESNGK